MGDVGHNARTSDHNLGNAIDLTNSPAGGFSVRFLAELFRVQMKANPIGGRLSYIIFDRRICSAPRNWEWRSYHGVNPHLTHAHFSIKATHRMIVRPWRF